MDFLAFMEETRKQNNTYFIDVFIIENVELRLIENGGKNIVILYVCTCIYANCNGYHLLDLGVGYSVILLNNYGLIMQEKSLFCWHWSFEQLRFDYAREVVILLTLKFWTITLWLCKRSRYFAD